MKKLNIKKLKAAHNMLQNFNDDNSGISFDIKGLLQYSFEIDLRETLRQSKYTEIQIDNIISKSKFNVSHQFTDTDRISFKFKMIDLKRFITIFNS